jgi:hypothetical protein
MRGGDDALREWLDGGGDRRGGGEAGIEEGCHKENHGENRSKIANGKGDEWSFAAREEQDSKWNKEIEEPARETAKKGPGEE